MWESLSIYLLLAQAEPKSQEVVIYRDNITQFKDRLIAPIVSWVESDIFRFKANEKPINEEKKVETSEVFDRVITSQNISKNVIYDADFAWLSGENLLRKAKVVFYREYSSFPPKKDQDVLYEEVFRFLEPPVVNSYATQTFRFTTQEEDQISHYSPVVGAVRPIKQANKSDPIIDGELSLDDLFVFSANPNSFTVKLVEQKVLLVPFSSEDSQILEKSPVLYSYNNNSIEKFRGENYPSLIGKQSSLDQRSLVLWNYEVKAFSSHAPWLPLTIVFEPRPVLIFELYPKDPFYSYGKQYLFVDAVTALPYYKLVYSYSGKFLKTIVGGWQKTSVTKEVSPDFKCENDCYVPVFVLSVDKAARNASILTVNNAQFYFDKQPELNFIFNDQQEKASEPSKQEPTKSEETSPLVPALPEQPVDE